MKIKAFLIAVLASVSMSSMAQFTNSGSSSRSAVGSADVEQSYSRIYASYAPMSLSIKDDSESYGGFAVGFLVGSNIASGTPLYLEYGANVQMNFGSDEGYKDDYKYTFMGVNVPLSLSYRYTLPNSNVSIAPYAGLHLKVNVIGKMSYGSESISYFDKDDVGKDNTANRIQGGWQAGIGINFTDFYIGIGYSGEFTDYMKKVSTGGLVASLGINF